MASEPPAVVLLSPKSSFEMLDYEQRLAAIEQSRLAALHHSTGETHSPASSASLALCPPCPLPTPLDLPSHTASPLIQRLLASFLAGLHTEGERGKEKKRRPHRRLVHSLSDSLIVRKGRWRGAADATLLSVSCTHRCRSPPAAARSFPRLLCMHSRTHCHSSETRLLARLPTAQRTWKCRR